MTIGEHFPKTEVSRIVPMTIHGMILVLRRASGLSNNAGRYEIPGGKNEGKDFEATCREELSEESGLALHAIEDPMLVSAYLMAQRPNSDRTGFYIAHAALGLVSEGPIRLSDEHDDYQWIRPADVLKRPELFTAQTVQAFGMLGLLQSEELMQAAA